MQLHLLLTLAFQSSSKVPPKLGSSTKVTLLHGQSFARSLVVCVCSFIYDLYYNTYTHRREMTTLHY